MLLTIDIGNTNTVFAVYRGDMLVQSLRQRTAAARTADEYALFVNDALGLEGLKFSDIRSVTVSSVVPEAHFQLEGFCRKYINVQPYFISRHDIKGIAVDLPNPEEVGADRLVNALAVTKHYQYPAIVVDFGTATTFDVIDTDMSKGNKNAPVYRGGVIAPGINLSVSALHQAASKLPKITIESVNSFIGRSTTEAMKIGVYQGYVGLIERIVHGLANEMSAKPIVIATGGLAAVFEDDLDCVDMVDQDLTLKGLYEIAKDKEI